LFKRGKRSVRIGGSDKKGDVVFQNEVTNFERFQQFLKNVANKKEDKIRVTGYTDEGDPVYQDLQFDGQEIQYKYDNSNDKYGGQDRGIEKDVCSKIIDRESENGQVEYLVSGCSSNLEHFLLRVEKK
jgi:hypothetical protein